MLSAGDTAKMQKVAGLIAKADPGGVTPRNNYTFLSLLLRTEEGNPHPAAENLHTENPANPVVATTYALSLFQQGKTGKALAVMSALKPEDLRSPLAAFYYGVFLIADGRADEAVEYVQIGLKRSLLPEEQAILARVKEAAAKQAELRRDDPGTAGGTKQLSRP